ncbi:MAG: ferritin-like domain-containing protein [Scytolyngbya sp. HA4215-MV1]|jgi:rubrerythrin|nr:ferritin-like domain-containing protein [Scytolyngbya sp. HA4215-MV1]
MSFDHHRVAGLALPHTHGDDRLRRVLAATLQTQSQRAMNGTLPAIYWDAAFFNLHQVQVFQAASHSAQLAILKLANQSLLEEAYWIEKAGVGYMAKMVLLAETLEERMLYGLFTADETTHLSQLCPFVSVPDRAAESQPFLRLLAEVVEGDDKTVLLFVIQVVLEGWGLSHYRRLAKSCDDRTLAHLFTSFLQAEARHHSTGNLLFHQRSVSAASQSAIQEVLANFLGMVQVGPQSVLAAIEQVMGHLSRSQKIQILTELDAEAHSGKRLQLLRALMQGESAGAIGQWLEAQGAFTPFPPRLCVSPRFA